MTIKFNLEVSSSNISFHLLEIKLYIPTPYKKLSSEATSLKILLSIPRIATTGATDGGLESTIFTFSCLC